MLNKYNKRKFLKNIINIFGSINYLLGSRTSTNELPTTYTQPQTTNPQPKTPNLLLHLTIIIILLTITSCTKTFNSEKELLDYIQDESNGYIHHKTVNGVDFTLLYKPTDLLVKQELGDDMGNKNKIMELRNKYSKYLYFNLSMSVNNKELLSVAPKNRNEFGTMVNQLAFGMKDKVHLYNAKKDTIELLDYVYPRMYGMSHATSMLFVYPRDEKKLKEKELNFTVEDLGLYTGEVKFKINAEKLNKELKLIL